MVVSGELVVFVLEEERYNYTKRERERKRCIDNKKNKEIIF